MIILRYKATQDDWVASTFILNKGEAGVALDTGAVRFGNGVQRWSLLPNPTSTVTTVAGRTGAIVLTKSDVGLGNVDNTADIAKPVSSATAAQFAEVNSRIDSLSISSGVTKETIGLGNVDNTSDMSKPVSTATQVALNAKAPVNNPTFTGNVSGVTKSMVGLAQVDNTTDLNKPISNATQAALNTKVSSTDSRLSNTRTPTAGSVTDVSVATNAAISLDKTVDSATRLAMTPAERTSVSSLGTTINNIHNGVITAGTGALAALVNPPLTSAIVAVGPSSLAAATTINSSVAVGDHALSDGINISNTIAFGDYALTKVSSPGGNDIAMGKWAGRGVTTGTGMVAIGINANSGRNNSDDVAVGRNANAGVAFVGLSGTWENYTVPSIGINTAIGVQALSSNGSGINNTAIGNGALKSITGASSNSAIGTLALSNLGVGRGPSGLTVVPVGSSGTYTWSGTQIVVAVSSHGVQVGDIVTLSLSGGTFTTDPTIYNGQVRGLVNSVIDANSFTITQAKTGVPIKSLTDAGSVTIVSYERTTYTLVNDNNLAWGDNAGSGLQSGSGNLLVGKNAGPQAASAINNLVAIGLNAFNSLTNATNSLAIGPNSGAGTTSATNSLLIGHSAAAPVSATNVTIIGTNAVASGSTATAIGQASTVASNGIALGNSAVASAGSVIIGNSSTSGLASVSLGNGTTAGDNSVSIGDSADSLANGIAIGQATSAGTNGIAIGTGVVAGTNVAEIATDVHTTNIHGTTLNIGTTLSNSAVNIGSSASIVNVGTSNTAGAITLRAQLVTIDDAGVTSDARDKTDVRDTRLGLEFIKALRPVEYRWAKRDERVQGKRYHQGFIAQEVKKTADDFGIDFAGYYDEKVNGGQDKLGLRPQEFHAPFVKALQELAKRVEYLESHQCDHDTDEHWT